MSKNIIKLFLIFIMTTHVAYALTFEDTLRETLNNNPEILIVAKEQQAIVQEVKQSKAGYYPKLRMNIGYGPDKARNSNTVTAVDPSPIMPKREASVLLDQMIFDGFATSSDVARNRARVTSADNKILSTVLDTMQRNIEVYVGVLRELELLQLTEDNLVFHQKIQRLVRLRTQSGISVAADLYQADARADLAKSNVLAETSNVGDAKANFYRTVGLEPVNLTAPPIPNRSYLPKTLEEAVDVALATNPTIKSADSDIDAAIKQHDVAKSTNYPHFDITMGASRDRNVGGVRGASFDQYAVLHMTYTVFNGGADISKQSQTAYQVEEAKDIKQRAIRQLTEAVKLSWDAYTTAVKQLPWLKAHVDSAQKTVDAYFKQYTIGQRTLLDMLDGRSELFAANRAYISGKYEIILTEYHLLKDMGLLMNALNVVSNQSIFS